jgi:hypothetical protein
MQKEKGHAGESDKKLAAVYGLYCEACSWFIATAEDRERLTDLQGIGSSFEGVFRQSCSVNKQTIGD